MSELLQIYLWAAPGILLFMTLLYFIQQRTNDAGIADVGWSASLGFLAIVLGLTVSGDEFRRVVIMGLAGFWSLRLTVYLLWDRIATGKEEGRYQAFRIYLGNKTSFVFFFFFIAQGILALLLSFSFAAAASNPAPYDAWIPVGIALFLLSITGESIADAQLARFRARPENRGTTCRIGLWRYSRHPNYFFEWLHWWVYVVLSIGSPLGWLSWIAPPLMLLFILFITGIPPTEAQAKRSRPDYALYQQTTSAFLPWFPRKEPS